MLVLDRLQSFLPQMAQANETLRQQMENLPAGHFDVESVEEAEKVIEMVRLGFWSETFLLIEFVANTVTRSDWPGDKKCF